MNLIEIVIQEVEQFNEDLAKILDERNFTDTGKAKESLRVESSENEGKFSVQSIGVNYLEFLQRGSEPWADQSAKAARKLGYILQVSGWAERRGVNPYAVANIIVKKGSQVFRGKRSGLEVEKLVEDLKDRIKLRIIALTKFEIEQKIGNMKKIFNKK